MDGRRRYPAMNAFYIEDGRLLKDEQIHAERVLRLSLGSRIVAMDGHRRYLAELRGGGAVEILEELPDNEAPISLTIYQGVPKADKLEFLAQKLTELGVKRLVPVQMERSIKKIDKAPRLERIAREAAKQCGRARPLEIAPPMAWKTAVREMGQHALMIAPWEEAREGRVRDLPRSADVGVLIGPEGGISAREIEESGARTITLGPRILRTETAAVAAASLILSAMGDL